LPLEILEISGCSSAVRLYDGRAATFQAVDRGGSLRRFELCHSRLPKKIGKDFFEDKAEFNSAR